jgi:hypothetical protein
MTPPSSQKPHVAHDQPDDIDALFTQHLHRADVPEDFTQRVLASTVKRQEKHSAFAWPWTVVGLAALTVLVMAGYSVGAALGGSSGLDVLNAVVSDLGLLTAMPDEVLAAFAAVIPWWLIAISAVSAVFLVVAVANVVTRGSSALRSQRA